MGTDFEMRQRILVSAIMLSNLIIALDSSLSASTHVAVATIFNSANVATWPVNSFLVCSLIVQPLYARMSDYIGRKLPYVCAIAIFAFATALSSIGNSWHWLLFTRALCGVGIGGMLGMGSITLTDVVGLSQRPYYQSVNYIMYGVGSALGSSFGSSIVERLGWRWVFAIQIPLCIPVLVVLALWAPSRGSLSSTATNRNACVMAFEGFDWLGSACLTATLVFLFIFLTTGGNVYPWLSLPVLGAGFGLSIAIYFLIRVESAKENPIVEIQMVCSHPVRNLMLTGLLLNMTNYIVMYYVPVFSQAVLLDTPEEAGVRLMVPSISFTATSALSSYLIARLGSGLPTLYLSQVFLIFGTAGLLSIMLISLKSALPSIVITTLLTLPVVGASMMAPSALMTLLNTVSEEKCAIVNSNFILARSLGYFAATTLGATVLQNTYSRVIEGLGLSQADFEKAKQAQRKVSLVHELPQNLQSHVKHAFVMGLAGVFCLPLCAAIIMIILLSRLRVTSKLPSEEYHAQSAYHAVELLSFDDEELSEASKGTNP